ncbi:MAG: secretin and TonB N-terminal domain-containing protein [Armatimonadota bacterium]|nr:secretin and TonB N-terminal domain-containing protein [bacterium]
MHYILRLWRPVVATAVAGAALIAIMAASSANAANGIMLQIKDAPLKDVVMLLTQQSGTNIVIADDTKLEKKITASLKDVPLEKALDYIVKGAGVSYRKAEDGTYIIGGATSDESAISLKDVAAALPPVEMPSAAYAPAQESQFVVVKLINSKPSELLRLLGWNGVNPQPNCEPIYPESMMPKQEQGAVSVISNNGQIYDPTRSIRMQNSQQAVPTIDPSSLNRGAGRTADQNTGAAQYGDVGGIRPPGYNPSSGRPGGTTGTSSTTSSSNRSGSNNGDDFLWPDGVDDARPFDLDNSIIVKGTEDGIEKFKKIVRMLDVPPKQVQIKAEFVEVKTTDVKRFGIDWSLDRLNESFNTAFGPMGNVIVGFTSGNLTAQLKAQLTSDIGRVINSPIISTINNQTAQIQISTIIPYWESISTVVGDTVIDQAVARYINVQTQLSVLPRVNGDGTITMQLYPQVADTGNQVQGPGDAGSIPEQRTQALYTQRRVANGETIVVGGFIRKNDSNSYQKIPILADLPIVGGLFRTHAKTTEDRELLIFVTPTIIADSGAGTVGDSLVP